MQALKSSTLILNDGRTLGYAEYGDPAGKPIFVFHGTPGSRYLGQVFDQAGTALGVRIIAPERPGYGLSSSHRGRLIDYPDDIHQLAAALGLEQFAVIGVSGGGPAALACAYRLPSRLSAVGLVSAMGPMHLLDVSREMVTPNRVILGILGRRVPALTGSILRLMLRLTLPSMRKHMEQGTSPSPELSPEIYALVAQDQGEAIRSGAQGAAYDLRNLWHAWGFDLPAIRVPVYLWHGEADNLMPVAMARFVAGQIPNAHATYYPGEDHAQPMLRHAEDILNSLIEVERATI
jgi:pimeloyl-ACP methyl ester carboxylesterase